MRTFIALEIPDLMRWEVAEFARQLEKHVNGRFITPDNYHVTLAFLGDVAERDIALAVDVLESACADRPAPLLSCDGLGKFGNANDATLWLGLATTDALADFAETVRDDLAARDISFDEKPFRPHITIARRASISKAALPPLPFPESAHACAATLFKSELDSDGAIYMPIHSVNLGD